MDVDVFNVYIFELEGVYSDKKIDCYSHLFIGVSRYTGMTFKVM
jgi:hypothetical protein